MKTLAEMKQIRAAKEAAIGRPEAIELALQRCHRAAATLNQRRAMPWDVGADFGVIRAYVERLEGALAPFAKIAPLFDEPLISGPSWRDTENLWEDFDRRISVQSIKHAAQVLNGQKRQSQPE